MKVQNILFITWDGPQTSYAEGLFMPIFHEIEKNYPYLKFYFLQFTWGGNQSNQEKASRHYNIPYAAEPIYRKPLPAMGSIITLLNGKYKIKKYIKTWNIDILMPRSNFPAYMVNCLNLPTIFDADGLPIEERIDFAGLKENGFMHKFLKNIEKKAILNADHIITRSTKSIDYHLHEYDISDASKFSVVTNGRNTEVFKPNNAIRLEVRKSLQIADDTTTFIYAGSFGPQYGWKEMLKIFELYCNHHHEAHFIFLTGIPEQIIPLIPKELKSKFTVKRVPFTEVPKYLNAADIAFAIREPKKSMQGVAPIKLGEYLLMGIPTIASEGIGDTKDILNIIPGTLLYNHAAPPTDSKILSFIHSALNIDKDFIREKAIPVFSLEASAKSYSQAFTNLFT